MRLPGLKRRRVGASGMSYTAGLAKIAEVKVAVQEHGYVLKANIICNYNALSEKQASQFHTLLIQTISEAIGHAGERRKVNEPLFELADLTATTNHQGVNER